MPYPINNVTTADQYVDATTAIIDPPLEAPSMIVTGASVYYQTQDYNGLRGGGGQWNPEVFAPPGRYSFSATDFAPVGKCSGIRVRSAVAGQPAQISLV
jgi:hypothetical protein